jgi:tyrosine-specific transport protein
MVDFLGDGLKWERTGTKRLLLCLMIFVPPTIFSQIYPGIFMSALGLAGGVGEAILNGLIPIALVFVGAHRLKLTGLPTGLSNKPLLSLLFFIILCIMGIEIWSLL